MINVRKTSFFLVALRLASTFLKMASVLISARFFGASAERDAFVLAMSIIIVLPNLTFGVFGDIFRTKFVHIRESAGLNSAVESARTLVWCIFFTSIAIVIFGIAKTDWLAAIFSENLSDDFMKTLRLMIRLTLPLIVITQLCNYWTQALNCFESFYFPEAVAMVSGAVGIAAVVFLTPIMGIHSLVVSAYFSGFLSFAVVLFMLRKKCPDFLSLKMGALGTIKPYVATALPLFFGFLVGQIGTVVVNRFSTGFGVGNVAILDYAHRILSVPQGVVTSVIASVATPILAAHFANNRHNDFSCANMSFYRFMFILFAPCIFLMLFCSDEIGAILFSNEISANDMRKFSVTLSIFAVGLFGVMHYVLFTQGLIAKGQTAMVSIASVVNQIFILACNVLFAYRYGIWGFAASWSIFHIITGFILMIMIKNKIKDTFLSLVKISALYVFSFGAFFLTKEFFSISGVVPKIILNISVFAVFLFAGLFIFRFEERKNVMCIFKNIDKGSGNAKN